MPQTIPLFPLHTVLFPGGPLRLRLFEPRYLDMVGRCMRTQSEFGVAMIIDGAEVGPARTALIGTTARIEDFERTSDGLLGILARGVTRFRIESVNLQSDGLYVAEIEPLPDEPDEVVPEGFDELANLVRELYPQAGQLYGDQPAEYESAAWLSARVAELLPLTSYLRQRCLEIDSPLGRLHYLRDLTREAKGFG
jgi:Lon protease-like protein